MLLKTARLRTLKADTRLSIVGLDLTIQWLDASDDDVVMVATQTLLKQAKRYAKSQRLFHEFVYLNYALESQDPIAGYGAENVARMKAASSHYDPEQVFQKLVPGGFKLNRKETACC